LATKTTTVDFVKTNRGAQNLRDLENEVNEMQNSSGWGVYEAISSALSLVGKTMPIAASIFDMAAAAEQDYLESLEDFYSNLYADMNGGSNLAVITVSYKFTSSVRDGNTVWVAKFPTATYSYS
jgi:hypothetical protein